MLADSHAPGKQNYLVYVAHDVNNRSDHEPILLSLLMNLTPRTFIPKKNPGTEPV